MELKMYEYGMAHVYPSVTAAASLLIARKVVLGVGDWVRMLGVQVISR